MTYKFNDNTLIHAIGFNPMKLEGILKYGIITDNYARKHNITYSRNYNYYMNVHEITYLFKDLEIAFLSVESLDEINFDYKDAMNDYRDIILEINSILSENVYKCFSNILNKEVTVMDMVDFINSKYDNKNIVYLESKGRVK